MTGSSDGVQQTDASNISMGGETVSSTVARFAMALLGFVGTVIFARVLGPTSFGGFYILFGVVKLADRPINGWANAAKKRYSEAGVSGEQVVGAAAIFIVGWTTLAVLVAVLAGDLLISYTGLRNAPFLFAVLLLSVSIYEPLERLVQAHGRVGAATWMDTLRSLFTFSLQLVFIVLLGLGAAGMVYGLATASLLVLPLSVYILHTRPSIPTRNLIARLWKFARYSIPSSFFGTMYARFDVLLLGFLVSQAAAANYEVAAKVALPAMFVAQAIGNVLMPRVSNLRSRDRDTTRDVSNALAFTSILALPIFFGAVILARPVVVTLYGSEYAEAAVLLIVIAAYNVFASQSTPLQQTLSGLDRPEVNMRLSAAALSVNIVLGIVLTLQVGPVGVAIATLVAELLRNVAAGVVVRKELPDVTLFPRTLWEQIGASLLMFGAVGLAHRFVPVNAWYDLIALVGLGGVIYTVVLLTVSQQLRHTVASVLDQSRIEQFVPTCIINWK